MQQPFDMRFPLFYVGTRPFSGDTEWVSLPGHPSRSLPSATKIRLPRRPFRLCRLPGPTGQTKYTPSTAIRLDRKPDTQPLWPCFVLSNKHCFCFQHGIDFLFRPMEHSRPQRLYHLKIYANFPSEKGSPRMTRPQTFHPMKKPPRALQGRLKSFIWRACWTL